MKSVLLSEEYRKQLPWIKEAEEMLEKWMSENPPSKIYDQFGDSPKIPLSTEEVARFSDSLLQQGVLKSAIQTLYEGALVDPEAAPDAIADALIDTYRHWYALKNFGTFFVFQPLAAGVSLALRVLAGDFASTRDAEAKKFLLKNGLVSDN